MFKIHKYFIVTIFGVLFSNVCLNSFSLKSLSALWKKEENPWEFIDKNFKLSLSEKAGWAGILGASGGIAGCLTFLYIFNKTHDKNLSRGSGIVTSILIQALIQYIFNSISLENKKKVIIKSDISKFPKSLQKDVLEFKKALDNGNREAKKEALKNFYSKLNSIFEEEAVKNKCENFLGFVAWCSGVATVFLIFSRLYDNGFFYKEEFFSNDSY